MQPNFKTLWQTFTMPTVVELWRAMGECVCIADPTVRSSVSVNPDKVNFAQLWHACGELVCAVMRHVVVCGRVSCLAGRAAQRLQETVNTKGARATTVHRLLGYQSRGALNSTAAAGSGATDAGEGASSSLLPGVFSFCAGNPLEADAVLVRLALPISEILLFSIQNVVRIGNIKTFICKARAGHASLRMQPARGAKPGRRARRWMRRACWTWGWARRCWTPCRARTPVSSSSSVRPFSFPCFPCVSSAFS